MPRPSEIRARALALPAWFRNDVQDSIAQVRKPAKTSRRSGVK